MTNTRANPDCHQPNSSSSCLHSPSMHPIPNYRPLFSDTILIATRWLTDSTTFSAEYRVPKCCYSKSVCVDFGCFSVKNYREPHVVLMSDLLHLGTLKKQNDFSEYSRETLLALSSLLLPAPKLCKAAMHPMAVSNRWLVQ